MTFRRLSLTFSRHCYFFSKYLNTQAKAITQAWERFCTHCWPCSACVCVCVCVLCVRVCVWGGALGYVRLCVCVYLSVCVCRLHWCLWSIAVHGMRSTQSKRQRQAY